MVRFNGQWRSQNARTLKKLRTSNGDYCIKQWFSTIKEQFLGVWKITFTTLGELPWVLLFLLRTCVVEINGCFANDGIWILSCHQLKKVLSGSANDQCAYTCMCASSRRQSYFIHARAADNLWARVYKGGVHCHLLTGGWGGYQMVWKNTNGALEDKAFINGLLINRLKVR